MSMRALIQKDLLILTRDRRALMILLVTPAVFIAILGFSTGKLFGWQNTNDRIEIALADLDTGDVAREVTEALASRHGLDVVQLDSETHARLRVDDGEAQTAIILGTRFQTLVDQLALDDLLHPDSGRLAGGLEALDIEVYARPTHQALASVTEQLLYGVMLRTLLPHVARNDPLAKLYLDARVKSERSGPSAEDVNENMAEPSGNALDVSNIAYQIIVPSYTVLFAFFLVNLMARSFLTERHRGTLTRLQLAPIRVSHLLVGKTLPFLLISLIQGVLLFTFGKLLFGMSWGVRPWMLLPVILCTSLAATTMGLLTAVLVRTDAQVSAYVNLLVITLGGLSGCFMPREWLPETMRHLSLAIPHAWSLIAYDQVLNSPHPHWPRVWNACGVLLVFSTIFYTAGWLRYRTQRQY